jgi:hypothetical protein
MIITKLNDIIPYLPYTKEGKYNNLFSYVLIGGSSYKSTYFNKFPGNTFYRSFNYEKEYPNINFQKRLSKITQTFSFDRPTDLLNHNLYSNEHYTHIYIATKTDLTIKNYANFIKNTLDYHKIKPPYIFIVFSEGGYDVLCFAKYYKHLIKQIYFIDTPFLEKYMLAYEKYRGNTNWYNDILRNKLSNKTTQEKIDVYNFEIKTLNIILKLKLTDIPKDIPIHMLWSPYYDNPTQKDKTKIKIIKAMISKLRNYKNITTPNGKSHTYKFIQIHYKKLKISIHLHFFLLHYYTQHMDANYYDYAAKCVELSSLYNQATHIIGYMKSNEIPSPIYTYDKTEYDKQVTNYKLIIHHKSTGVIKLKEELDNAYNATLERYKKLNLDTKEIPEPNYYANWYYTQIDKYNNLPPKDPVPKETYYYPQTKQCSYQNCTKPVFYDGRCSYHGYRGVMRSANGQIIYDGRGR